MKKLFVVNAVFLLSIVSLSAQKTENIKVTGAEYPDFMAKTEYKFQNYTRANISFKSGELAIARINYNNFLQSLKYIGDKRDTLEIANANDVNYISVGDDTIFYDNGYYQWVASSGTARLATRVQYKEVSRALVGAFGTASPAKNIESVSKILGERSYELGRDEVLTLSKITTYYISHINGENNHFVVANKANIKKLFPKKNIEEFIKENRIYLNKEKDLIDLMVYISKSN